ncbi:MAG: tail fiber domain-containing protein, partial [Thermoplasmata archaeon]|nr:tail fiber domain-containing protein [Thermoplasmata archaeon]
TRNYVLHPDYTASAQSNAVCYNTGTKLVTYNSGATTCLASSEKTKKNIIQLSEDFSTRLMQLKPIYYTSEIDGQNHYGLLAEDVTKVFPELVARDEGGNLSGVRYEEFTGVLLKGYQEQQVKLNNICTNNPKLCEV